MPLQGAERAPFRGDPALESALELASHQDGEFVVVVKGEGSKKAKSKYSAVGSDVELGASKHHDAADGETVCRVCHLGLSSGSIELGCACKQDLALCHRKCAEEWFKIRGNTVCEICGETAKNVHLPEPTNPAAAAAQHHLETAEPYSSSHREFANATAMTRLRYLWANQLIRNSLLASMIVVFMVPWFFRIAYF